jgi:esterase
MQLFFKESGQGQPIIILHGLFGLLDNWTTIAKYLSEKYRIILVDQRNHGRSPHTDDFNYQLMADDLKEFILEHQIENPIIIGHSMGGKVAMTFAVQNPNMLQKLVVVDIAPKDYPVHHDAILDGLFAIKLDQLTSRNEADEILAKYVPEFDTRQFLLKNLYRKEDMSFAWRINLPVLAREIENIGKGFGDNYSFEKPTLFIRGLKSNYIKEKDFERIHSIFTDCKIDTIENAGHWVHAETPKEFLESLGRFLLYFKTL